ncbi:MAG: hypothetical protein PHT59_02100 [Candidatus Omnitrophica bacterium]|nr:hypothetical protein [Candidatus Omnitrophota bacterium]
MKKFPLPFLLVAACLGLTMAAFAVKQSTGGYRVEPGQTDCINEPSVGANYVTVRNNNPTAIFAPTNSSAEWQAFRNGAAASNVVFGDCTPPPPTPAYRLRATFTGSGTVQFAVGASIATCISSCTQVYDEGTVVNMTLTNQENCGPCTSAGGTCTRKIQWQPVPAGVTLQNCVNPPSDLNCSRARVPMTQDRSLDFRFYLYCQPPPPPGSCKICYWWCLDTSHTFFRHYYPAYSQSESAWNALFTAYFNTAWTSGCGGNGCWQRPDPVTESAREAFTRMYNAGHLRYEPSPPSGPC